MTSVIILGFLAGALFIYGLPYLAHGTGGKNLDTPLGDSPTASVGWGWISWVVAVLLWHAAPMHLHPRAAFVATAAGILVVGWAVAAGMLKAGRR
jgi:hypothetical protein